MNDLAQLHPVLDAINHWTIYWIAIAFYGLYPVITSLVWIATALVYFVRRDLREQEAPLQDDQLPLVSVLLPAYCEEEVIGQSIEGLLKMDYPRFEVIVINDGSPDGTAARVRPFLTDPRVRLLNKHVNEGKAMALNDAIPCTNGELILIMDADAVPDPKLLRVMVPHFRYPRVAAVAGNPRVRNTTNLLTRLQAVEFSSVIGLMRRAQRIWGRVMCISGVVGMFRKSAMIDVGMYTPGMATEDIDLTWKLQRHFYDVRYEGRALVWMLVPDSLPVWWKQRRRWALGLGQVLRRHATIFGDWRLRRMFPLFVESALSYLWALTFLSVTTFWVVCYASGYPPKGGSPMPNLWGMLLFTFCLFQLACGTWIDSKYDPTIKRHFPASILYPSFYWFLLATTSFIYTTRGLLKRVNLLAPTRWHIQHSHAQDH
jgi:biofilm PGA synthesis N-glycosyltransferase PgaC